MKKIQNSYFEIQVLITLNKILMYKRIIDIVIQIERVHSKKIYFTYGD